jgi:hypothetical protein
MAAVFIPYAHTSKLFALGAMRLNTDSFYVALVQPTYTVNLGHTTWESGSDPYDKEVTAGNGYTAGGILVGDYTLTNEEITVQDALDVDALTKDFRYLVFYKLGSGGGLTNPLFGYVDFGTTLSVVAKDLLITFPGEGILNLKQNTY